MPFVALFAALAACSMGAEQDLVFDVVFLIDGSKSALPGFNNFTRFVRDLMSPYNVGLNGARVGLIVVAPDIDDQPPPAANLNSITDSTMIRFHSQSIIQKKQYGIITVGYGEGLDHKKLHSISGGSSCTLMAKDATELQSQIKPIQRHIMHADANNGIYCNKV